MKQFSTFFSKLLPLALAWGLSLPSWGQVINYSPVPLTAGSFTADVIANGTAAVSPVNSTTADVDGAGYYLISQDYYTATTPHTSGLPNTGLIPNSITGYSALTYQLASYSANNSLRLAAAGTGTATFATPTAASEVYVLAISGSGATTVTMTVNYSDGTNTAFASQSYPDWFTVSATQNVFGASGRASVTAPVSATAAANTAPFLSQVKLTIPAAKISTAITGISFTTTAGSGLLNVLAVSAGVPAPNCTAAPTSLQAVASTTSGGGTVLTSACASTSIYLSLAGATALTGYTYQWQSSTTSATAGFTDITGATSSTYTTTGQAVTTYYRVQVGCQFAGTGSTPTASTAVQVTQNAPTSCYCTPTYSNGGSGDYIARVQLGTLDNNTAATGNVSPYYTNYSAQQTGTTPTLQIPNLAQGSTATATLTFGPDTNQYNAIWIDFNQNGSFEASEYFAGPKATGNGVAITVSIVVPATATLGQTRMRVRGGDDSQPTSAQACGASSTTGYGEAEDYLVNMVVAPPCTPSTAAFSYGISPSYCVNGATNPIVTLATGATAGTFSSTTGLTINPATGAITLSSSTPGTYTITNTVAATATNCASTATTTVTITAAPTAGFSYATPGAGAACVGGTGTFAPVLASGATAGTYSSTTGLTINATTGVISLAGSVAGTYTVTNSVAATATTCAATSTATFTVNALPATPTLTTTGTPATGITLTSSAATGNQFYLNGVLIAGATGTSYLINSGTKNGSYTVTVTNAAGCSATSAAVNVTVTAATLAQASTALTVSPNPTPDGLVALELSGFREAVTLTVTNTLGQRVAESTVASSALGQKQMLNLSALPAGVYVLQARTASGAVEVRRIVRE